MVQQGAGKMADSFATVDQLITLPLELLQMVVDHTTKKELKSLRATNKFLHKFLTPLLFESFNVYPHVRSFEYLIKAAETPHIGPLIQYLTYDAGFLGVTDMVVRRLQSVYSASITSEEKKAILDHAKMLHSQSLPADNALDEIALMSYLEQAFVHLPNLKYLRVVDAFRMSHYGETGRLPSFYEQLTKETCGKYEHTRLERGMIGPGFARTTYARALLMATHKLKKPLEVFDLQRVRWSYLLQQGDLSKHAKFWEKSFEGLRRLELATAGENMPIGSNAMANLQTLLRPAVNLEDLSITFRENNESRYCGQEMMDVDTGLGCHSVFGTAPHEHDPRSEPVRLTWSPKLRRLHLAGLVCTKTEIKTILKQSAATLTKLSLRDFVLMPNELPGNRACLVEFFKWMQKHLQLEEIDFAGVLTNGGMQAWYLPWEAESPENLLGQVKRFILKGGVNPLEHVAITPGHYDVQKKTYTGRIPEALTEDRYHGDASFMMEYDDYDDTENEEEDLDDLDDDEDTEDEDEDDDLFLGHPPAWHPMPFLPDYDSDLGEDDEFVGF